MDEKKKETEPGSFYIASQDFLNKPSTIKGSRGNPPGQKRRKAMKKRKRNISRNSRRRNR